MIRYGIIATVFLLLAVAVTATFHEGEPTESRSSMQTVTDITGQGDLQQRVVALEAAVREERQLRIRMEETLATLLEQGQLPADQLATNTQPRRAAAAVNAEGAPITAANLGQQLAQRRNDPNIDPGDRQMERLVAAGFDEYKAADIVRMQEESQMQLLNARFEAIQGGERINPAEMQLQAIQEMKNTLGEADYEKYLQATRQPISVDVRNVLASSPAQLAGLQSGDEIVRYSGQRVYNINELNRLANSPGNSGSVLVEVLRDGQPISLSLPAGPIGITSGRGGGF